MDYFLTILGIFVSILLILVILLQRGRGGGLVGALSGLGGQSAFGTKAGDTFTRITIGIAAVWVVLAGITGQVFRSSTNLFRGDDAVAIESKTKDTGARDAKKFDDSKDSKKDSKDADDKESETKEPLKPEDSVKEDSTKDTKKEVESPKADKESKPEEKTKPDEAPSKDEKSEKPESADKPTDSK